MSETFFQFYYINTDELPNHFTLIVFWCERCDVVIATVIISHVQITCYFHMWRYQVFMQKLTLYFIGVYIISTYNCCIMRLGNLCYNLLFKFTLLVHALQLVFHRGQIYVSVTNNLQTSNHGSTPEIFPLSMFLACECNQEKLSPAACWCHSSNFKSASGRQTVNITGFFLSLETRP